jgi:alpha-beta hydrolase superfamily lysophospholipase
MITKPFTMTTTDNTKLFVYTWLPDKNKCKAIVFILHGMAEHAGRYERFARFLTGAGFGIYAHDQRGHGKSVADKEDLGFLGKNKRFGCLVDDAYELAGHIKKDHPDLPIILLGHSLGSYIALGYIGQYGSSVNGCIFSGPGYPAALPLCVGKMLIRGEIKKHGGKYRSRKINDLTFGGYNKPFAPARTAFDWLSRDTNEVDTYIGDPLCGFICTSSFFLELSEWFQIIFNKENVSAIPDTLPLSIFAGGKDPAGKMGKDVKKLYKMYKRAGIKDITSMVYPGARHEILNETNREQVMKDVLTWITAHL